LTVAARRTDAATATAELAVDAKTCPWSERTPAAGAANLIVNATPIGMGAAGASGPALPVDAAAITRGHVVVDLVYDPVETPLLEAARTRGATAVDGLGMLVHQAALQVERWAGQPAPVDAMRAAAAAALAP
jgi:shikimate dehydrogenase